MTGQIYIEAHEVDVLGRPFGAMHLYLVFRDSNGEEYVIRSGPESDVPPWSGPMKIETNVPMGESADDRGAETPADRSSTALDFAGLTDDEAWAIMVKYARMIDAADSGYDLLSQNSNSFIGAMLAAAGGDPEAMLPEGVSPGSVVGFSNYVSLLAGVPPPEDGTVRGTDLADRIAGIQIDEVIRAFGGADRVEAGRGNDQIYGNAGRDRLFADAGHDTLIGGQGKDRLHGGTDDQGDVFVFAKRSHSEAGASRDLVFAFTNGMDDLDLREIDADRSTRRDDAFNWAGQEAAARSVWWEGRDDGVLLRADLSGDAKADFEILLKGVSSLGLEDLLL